MSVDTMHVAIPCLDEFWELPKCLDSLCRSTERRVEVWICVNQPDHWWQRAETREICERNRATLEWLSGFQGLRVHVLDRCSPGFGWKKGKGGVGRARREIVEAIAEKSSPKSLVVSLDADTVVGPRYLSQVRKTFLEKPGIKGLLATYFHRLSGDESRDRAILRYEIYLRVFLLSLFRIESPYAFTALGSVLSFPLENYFAVGGFPARKAGEDFYFVQKLRKYGSVALWGAGPVFPSARASKRVPFGTGPAVQSGMGDETPYRLFPFDLFKEIKVTTELFGEMFQGEVETPMDGFFEEIFGEKHPFLLLRRDHKTKKGFIRACNERLDGLRLFQYLRRRRADFSMIRDEDVLSDLLRGFGEESFCEWAQNHPQGEKLLYCVKKPWKYSELPLEVFAALRSFLFHMECVMRQKTPKE